VNLELAAYVPASEQLRDWAYTNIHKEFYMEAVYSQSEFTFGKQDAEIEEDDADTSPAGSDEDEPEPESVEVEQDSEIPFESPEPAVKSGPKNLAAYHAEHGDDGF